MTAAKRVRRRSVRAKSSKSLRYTVDASVFVNAFNPHEDGHAESLQILAAIQERGDPVIVPTLLRSGNRVGRGSGQRRQRRRDAICKRDGRTIACDARAADARTRTAGV